MSEPSWSDLPSAAASQQAIAPRDPEFDQLCAEIFMSGAGKRLIEMLRARYFESPFSPMAPDRSLRIVSAPHLIAVSGRPFAAGSVSV